MKAADSTVHLCDTCVLSANFPTCMPDEVEFGEGVGNDNIIECSKWEDK